MLYISFQLNDPRIFEIEEFYKHIRIKPETASDMWDFFLLFLLFC